MKDPESLRFPVAFLFNWLFDMFGLEGQTPNKGSLPTGPLSGEFAHEKLFLGMMAGTDAFFGSSRYLKFLCISVGFCYSAILLAWVATGSLASL